MIWEQKSKELQFLALKITVWAVNYVHMKIIFHSYIEENRIETFCFTQKSFISGKVEENGDL